jgi:tight adherence protein B
LLSVVLGLACYLLFSLLVRSSLVAGAAGCLALSLPFFHLKMKKNKRMKRFQKQLPESLDLLVRSLRAGHAFPTGLQLVADQFDEPLGPEFRATLDEINFGVSVSDALKNLSQRVDCPDLKYFVVSVILQRETGGNLAEIMESIAYIIRERFKLQRKVDVLSTEGRMSAMVLSALPFVVFVVLHFMSPGYTGPLWGEYLGRVMLGIAGVMMLVGFVWIKRIITIRV